MPDRSDQHSLQARAGERKEKINMANYGIMRTEKRGRGSIHGLQIEANRKREDHDRGRDFDGSDIDWTRTNGNIFLRHCENWSAEIVRQIHSAGVRDRKNSIVMIDALYTASPGFFEGKRHEEIVRYFKDCLAFHEREYGKAFNAVIHLDEATPHMHVASVPIIEDEKGAHLSAKIIMGGRGDYRTRQDRFYDEVTKHYGLERGEVREPAETKTHTTKREWQLAVQEERAAQAEQRMELALRQVQEAEEQKERSLRAARKAERQVNEAKAELDFLDAQKEAIETVLRRLRDEGRLAERKHYRTFGGEEYIRITPKEAKAIDAAVAVKTPLLEAEAQAQAIVCDAQAYMDELLQQAHIEIRLYKEMAQKAAEQYKRKMDDYLTPQRSRSYSRDNHKPSRGDLEFER